MRACSRVALLFAIGLLIPRVLFAQASLAGVVKDTSGAVLPGVTVEASSPELIEKLARRSPTPRASTELRTCGPAVHRDVYAGGLQHGEREGVDLAGFITSASTPSCAWARSRRPSRSPANRRSSTCRPRRANRAVERHAHLTPDGRCTTRSSCSRRARAAARRTSPWARATRARSARTAHSFAGRANEEGRLLLDGLSIAVPRPAARTTSRTRGIAGNLLHGAGRTAKPKRADRC